MKIIRLVVVVLCCLLFCLSDEALAEEDGNTLKLALLPVPDVLPVYVAIEKGYFSERNLVVEALPVGSALERDQLMQAGRVDGMVNELAGAANFNREKPQVKIISIARSPMAGAPLFRILAAPGSSIKTVADLAGVPIGISKNTVIEYITNRLLLGGGVAADAISYKSIPVLPERLQLLLSGQVQAVTLPDPLGAAAIKGGAVEVVNDTAAAEFSASVLTFTNEALSEKSEAVKNFMIAWDQAAADINSEPESFRGLMLKKIRVPKNVQDDFPIPPIPRRKLPTREQWQDVMAWMIQSELLSQPLVYEESVTGNFLASE